MVDISGVRRKVQYPVFRTGTKSEWTKTIGTHDDCLVLYYSSNQFMVRGGQPMMWVIRSILDKFPHKWVMLQRLFHLTNTGGGLAWMSYMLSLSSPSTMWPCGIRCLDVSVTFSQSSLTTGEEASPGGLHQKHGHFDYLIVRNPLEFQFFVQTQYYIGKTRHQGQPEERSQQPFQLKFNWALR